MAITWTKDWSGSDDGTVLKAVDLRNIQDDLANVVQTSDSNVLDGNTTWDPGSIADGDEEAQAVTVTGAVLGDFALASFSLDITDLTITAAVTASNTVTVVLANNTGGAIDLASGTVYARVLQRV